MSVSRRDFLKGAAAGALLPAVPGQTWAQAPAPTVLRAGVFPQRIVANDQPETEVWGYNGSVPGPVLRYRKGERVRIELANALPEETTIHWHGVRVPNAMDGVPFVTQKPVPPGGSFLYEFDVPDSGTYWYHPHSKSFEQVGRGLYGAFIVDDAKPLEVDRELLWVLSDFKLWPDNQQVDDFGAIQDFGTVGRLGNLVAINGKEAGAGYRLVVRQGERIRWRLLNACSARIVHVRVAGHQTLVIAYDGQAVQPHDPGTIALGPGMRADVILDCPARPGERFSVVDPWNRRGELATIVYADEKPVRDKPLALPVALSPNALPEPDLAKASRHHIVFQGGMSGQPVFGQVDGKELGIRDMMAKHGLAWTINLKAAHEQALMHTPFLHLKKGEHVILTMVNNSGFEHPMHLHGYILKVLSYNGKAPRYPEWRDTIMMGPRETLDVAFVADNPGDWMFHCHILEHAAGGMLGTIRVG